MGILILKFQRKINLITLLLKKHLKRLKKENHKLMENMLIVKVEKI
jgi:hypothetical protein